MSMESVVALFRDPNQAQSAIEALKARGFDHRELGFAVNNFVAQEHLAESTGVTPTQGTVNTSANVLKGAGLGILAGLALTVPIWLIIMALPITRIYAQGGIDSIFFGVLAGAGMGALFGALEDTEASTYIRLLRGLGVPSAQAEKINAGIQQGNVLVIATGKQLDEALSLMRRAGAMKLDDVVVSSHAH